MYCDNFYSSGPRVDMLPKDDRVLLRKCLKSVKLPKGSYLAHSVDDKRYFLFQDRR